MTFVDALPTVNALMNATSAALIIAARVAIKRGHQEKHKRLMLMALGTSALFLVGYLTRSALTGTHTFPDAGWIKTVYLLILFSHMILAAAVVPLVLAAVILGLRGRFATHRKVVKWGWPIWVYVSVTGVVVYGMLYHLAPHLS